MSAPDTEILYVPFDSHPYLDDLDVVVNVVHCIMYGEKEYMDYSADEADDYLDEDVLEKYISHKYVVGANIFPKMWLAFTNMKRHINSVRRNETEVSAVKILDGYLRVELESTGVSSEENTDSGGFERSWCR